MPFFLSCAKSFSMVLSETVNFSEVFSEVFSEAFSEIFSDMAFQEAFQQTETASEAGPEREGTASREGRGAQETKHLNIYKRTSTLSRSFPAEVDNTSVP
jgi:hypothetical protein